MTGTVVIPVLCRGYGQEPGEPGMREVPVEAPVAIETNGIAYAVMMATPLDIEDFVTGFLLAEGLAEAHEIGPVAVHQVGEAEWGQGLVARVNLPAYRLGIIHERARRRIGDSSCGICGIESVEAALRPLPMLPHHSTVSGAAIRRGLERLRNAQTLGRLTAATHAAAFCGPDGDLVVAREDVGRHNALDKVIGAMARIGIDPAGGFLVVTSRCSYELVEKTVRAGCPLLVAISAPTDLAVRRAGAAGLTLAVVARDDTMLWIAAEREAPHAL
jgi:FdhD protein